MKLSQKFRLWFGAIDEEFLFCHPEIDIGMSVEEFRENKGLWNAFLMDFEKRFNAKYICEMIRKTFTTYLSAIEKKKKELLILNDNMRSNGKSFKEREVCTTSKISALEDLAKEVKSFYPLSLIPLENWLTPSDVWSMKELGMDRFFIGNWRRIIWKNN